MKQLNLVHRVFCGLSSSPLIPSLALFSSVGPVSTIVPGPLSQLLYFDPQGLEEAILKKHVYFTPLEMCYLCTHLFPACWCSFLIHFDQDSLLQNIKDINSLEILQHRGNTGQDRKKGSKLVQEKKRVHSGFENCWKSGLFFYSMYSNPTPAPKCPLSQCSQDNLLSASSHGECRCWAGKKVAVGWEGEG